MLLSVLLIPTPELTTPTAIDRRKYGFRLTECDGRSFDPKAP